MECNRDDAYAAKQMAERKFQEKDFTNAKKFALKAQQLHPQLQGISNLLAIFDVHLNAEFRQNGEMDCYKILGVDPTADRETITKHFRKMALLIHPDKNQELGSESAFKLLNDAFGTLNDAAKRSAYDARLKPPAPVGLPTHQSSTIYGAEFWKRLRETLRTPVVVVATPPHMKRSTHKKRVIDHFMGNFANVVSKRKKSDFHEKVISNQVQRSGVDNAFDFHDFGAERNRFSLRENEIWAVYDDDDDGMPRKYAYIRRVNSSEPFSVEMTWLDSETNALFGAQEWVNQGFAKTCGKFVITVILQHDIIKNPSLSIFSHKIAEGSGALGDVVHIYPARGDVWAVYKNWSRQWCAETPYERVHVYEVVQVVSDYSEMQGVWVVPLHKVEGFAAVFGKRDVEIEEAMRIRREEMFRFSHQIPSYLVTSEDGPDAPVGCLELDPASLPLEMLQVTPQDKTEDKNQGFLKS